MNTDRKVKGEFLIRRIKGTNYVLKHLDSETVTVAELNSSYYSDDETEDLITDLEEGDTFSGTIVNPKDSQRHVWTIASVDELIPNQS